MNPTAALLALVSAGVTGFAALLLALIARRIGEILWLQLLFVTVTAWLLLQGYGFQHGDWSLADPAINAVANLLGGIFLAFAVSPSAPRAAWLAFVAGMVMTGPAVINQTATDSSVVRLTAVVLLVWQVVAWGGGFTLLVRSLGAQRRGDSAKSRFVGGVLAAIAPVIFILSFVPGIGFYPYLFPLLMMLIAILVFVGVLRLRFYDVEVRVAERGAMAVELADRERLVVVGQLAATLAHEIRNPLTGIRSLAQRLGGAEVSDERRTKYAGVIVDEADRLERLVTTLLDVARRSGDAGPDDRLDSLGDVLSDVALLAASKARKAAVELAIETAEPSLPIPRNDLAQILLNLVLNALAASPPGGRVAMRTERSDLRLGITVSDEGPGLEEETAAAIWEPFRSGRGGSGLGLAIVRSVAERRGWTVTAENRTDRSGAEFRITIPLEGER